MDCCVEMLGPILYQCFEMLVVVGAVGYEGEDIMGVFFVADMAWSGLHEEVGSVVGDIGNAVCPFERCHGKGSL